MKKHYVLEIKVTEVTNETAEVYNSQTRHKENVKTGNRETDTLVSLHLRGESLNSIIGQAGKHLFAVAEANDPASVAAVKQIIGGGNAVASDEGYSYTRPIKDNPQA